MKLFSKPVALKKVGLKEEAAGKYYSPPIVKPYDTA
jgi:hypothetical protein